MRLHMDPEQVLNAWSGVVEEACLKDCACQG